MPLPTWATDPSCLCITEEEYEALPARVRKSIEVVDGSVIYREPPGPQHQRVSHNLRLAMMDTRPASPCIDVLQSTDMRFRYLNRYSSRERKHFVLRRPDISVVRQLERDARLYSNDVVTAVEITSSYDDIALLGRRAEYAAQRIPVCLIVVLDEDKVHSVDEYRLDWSLRNYQLAYVHRGSLDTDLPEGMKLRVAFSELESA